MDRSYPADLARAGLDLFLGWFGPHYARSTAVESCDTDGEFARARITVGRQWALSVSVANTLAADADLPWETQRAAIEARFDNAGHDLAVWVPRGAQPPSAEPGLSELLLGAEAAAPLDDGRLEMRHPVRLHLRRTAMTGSVITVLGGLSAHWAQFTNRVPGSFQLDSRELFRLPASEDERDALAEQIVNAAGQPIADESQSLLTDDCWTLSRNPGGRTVVLGTPKPENDEHSASLRRTLRRLLKGFASDFAAPADARALVVLGAATYAEEEKLSWALRGMDPTLYAGYDLVCVIADGVVKPLLQPGRSSLPWDAPVPGR